jgi:hypothetical protein
VTLLSIINWYFKKSCSSLQVIYKSMKVFKISISGTLDFYFIFITIDDPIPHIVYLLLLLCRLRARNWQSIEWCCTCLQSSLLTSKWSNALLLSLFIVRLLVLRKWISERLILRTLIRVLGSSRVKSSIISWASVELPLWTLIVYLLLFKIWLDIVKMLIPVVIRMCIMTYVRA